MSLVCWGAQHWTQYSDVASPGLCRGAEVTSLGFLAMLLLMQGGCLLYLLWGHMTVHSCLTIHQDLVLPFTKTPRSFSAELLSSQLVTSVYWWLGLFLIVELPWHFPLLNSMRFLSVHFSGLSRSLCMEAWTSAASAISPSFVAPASLLRVHCLPSSGS